MRVVIRELESSQATLIFAGARMRGHADPESRANTLEYAAFGVNANPGQGDTRLGGAGSPWASRRLQR